MNAMNYKLPWANNLTIGKTGNHAGFQSGANTVLAGLNNYLASYSTVNTRKIWINGYSRSAAIGDIVAYTLVDNNLVKEDNLYAYLFEYCLISTRACILAADCSMKLVCYIVDKCLIKRNTCIEL